MRLSTRNPTPKIDSEQFYYDTDQTYSYYSYGSGRASTHTPLPRSINGATSSFETFDFYSVNCAPREATLLAWGTQEVTVSTKLNSIVVQVPYFLLYRVDEVRKTGLMVGFIGKTKIMQNFTLKEWIDELEEIFLKAAAEYAGASSSTSGEAQKIK